MTKPDGFEYWWLNPENLRAGCTRGLGRSVLKLERNSKIVELFLGGCKFSDIAKRFQITPERVRQIIASTGSRGDKLRRQRRELRQP